MAIVVTAQGVAQAKAANQVDLYCAEGFAADDYVIVIIASDTSLSGTGWVRLSGAGAGGGDLLPGWDVEAIFNGNVVLAILSGRVKTSVGSGALLRAWDTYANAKCIAAYKVVGLLTAAWLDKTKAATGSSATPSSTATDTTTEAYELLIGGIGTEGPDGDLPGTWNGSVDENNQRLGTTGAGAASNITVAAATRIVSATGTYTASKTGITSRDWAAAIATYKSAEAPPLGVSDPAAWISIHRMRSRNSLLRR